MFTKQISLHQISNIIISSKLYQAKLLAKGIEMNIEN